MADESIPSFLSLRKGKGKQRDQSPQLAFDLTAPAPAPTSPPTATNAPARTYTPIVLETPVAPVHKALYTVRQLIAELKQHVEGGYNGLLNVEGEVSNCRPAASGHLYFTLKDGDAQLPVVMFRRAAGLLGFKIKDGLAVEVRGRISVYETRGQLQLIAETLKPRGTGALQLAFEQLRDRLRREGLFDRVKTPLPPFPQCIGIVTSPSGAAIRDIIQVVRRRHARLNILIYPAVMQGVQCATTVAAGIRWFNRHPERVDLIVLARGGGSLEDLAGFNDEMLARVIVSSVLPVVSAIGHEVDNTIADYVADLRAPTPSAAAELVTAAQHRIEERVVALERRVYRAGEFHLMRARRKFERLSAAYVLGRVRDSIGAREQRIDELKFRMAAAMTRREQARMARLAALEARLRRHDPTVRLALAQRRLAAASDRIARVAGEIVTRRRVRLERDVLRLEALSPLAVLKRGYAIVYGEDGAILRDAGRVSAGETIRARLANGDLTATVKTTVTPE